MLRPESDFYLLKFKAATLSYVTTPCLNDPVRLRNTPRVTDQKKPIHIVSSPVRFTWLR
jgi:hypothetical protein